MQARGLPCPCSSYGLTNEVFPRFSLRRNQPSVATKGRIWPFHSLDPRLFGATTVLFTLAYCTLTRVEHCFKAFSTSRSSHETHSTCFHCSLPARLRKLVTLFSVFARKRIGIRADQDRFFFFYRELTASAPHKRLRYQYVLAAPCVLYALK